MRRVGGDDTGWSEHESRHGLSGTRIIEELITQCFARQSSRRGMYWVKNVWLKRDKWDYQTECYADQQLHLHSWPGIMIVVSRVGQEDLMFVRYVKWKKKCLLASYVFPFVQSSSRDNKRKIEILNWFTLRQRCCQLTAALSLVPDSLSWPLIGQTSSQCCIIPGSWGPPPVSFAKRRRAILLSILTGVMASNMGCLY